jgi:hypothetical protein
MQIYGLCFIAEREVKPIPLQNVVVEANSKFIRYIKLFTIFNVYDFKIIIIIFIF